MGKSRPARKTVKPAAPTVLVANVPVHRGRDLVLGGGGLSFPVVDTTDDRGRRICAFIDVGSKVLSVYRGDRMFAVKAGELIGAVLEVADRVGE
jgi:hypothetical protein